MEEEKRVGIFKGIINAIKAFTSSEEVEGKDIKLSKEEERELKEVIAAGEVDKVEEGLLSKRYEYKVDSKEAVKEAAKKAKDKKQAKAIIGEKPKTREE